MSNNFKRKILIRKKLLNFLLVFLSPRNKFILFLSQDLDKLITKSQKKAYNRYLKKKSMNLYLNKVA
ncbi:hypothetical protein [Clostridium isatidis]|uniref:hypothetical protein n=1 Tax=Clostridium isatidis TaxID=182773 RepID=UPI003AAC37B7